MFHCTTLTALLTMTLKGFVEVSACTVSLHSRFTNVEGSPRGGEDLAPHAGGVNIVHDLIHISPLYIASCGSV